MNPNNNKQGLVNGAVLLLATVVSLMIARYAQSAAGLAATAFILLGFLAAILSWFQLRLEERERLEQFEYDELRRSPAGAALFETPASDTFPARRTREQFERFFVPGVTLLFLLLEGAAVYGFWKYLQDPPALVPARTAVAMALFALLGLGMFLLGKYATGMARLENQRLLRPAGVFLLLDAYLCFLVAAGIAAHQAGYPQVDLILARVLVVLLGLIGAETFLGLIWELYRPRGKDRPSRVLYESRLAELAAQPESLFTVAARTLDYQFGFKVSETWFYRFLQRAFAWIVFAQLGLLWLSSMLVFLDPGEQAVLERFGRPTDRPVLQPGPHLKLPWPIETIQRHPVGRMQRLTINMDREHDGEAMDGHGDHEGHDAHQESKVVLWTVKHHKEELNVLVATRKSAAATEAATAEQVPVNLLGVDIPVHYQIADLKAWVYHYTDAAKLLDQVATREVIRYLASADFNEVLGGERQAAANALRERIQAAADQLQLGVRILFVGLQDIHPPVAVAEAFEAAVGAQQEVQARKFAAQGYEAKTLALAQAEKQRAIHEAEGYRLTKLADAEARAAQFENQIRAFAAAPTVYPQRLYLETFARATAGSRKYLVMSSNTQDVIQFNLEEKFRVDLEDIQVPSKKTK